MEAIRDFSFLTSSERLSWLDEARAFLSKIKDFPSKKTKTKF